MIDRRRREIKFGRRDASEPKLRFSRATISETKGAASKNGPVVETWKQGCSSRGDMAKASHLHHKDFFFFFVCVCV